jgi:hypothetical protein
MDERVAGLAFCILAFAMSAAAQVTTSGTTTANTVPMFSSSSAITNSPITVSGSNLGIGTTSAYNGRLQLVAPSNNNVLFWNDSGITNTGLLSDSNALQTLTNNNVPIEIESGIGGTLNAAQLYLNNANRNVGIGTTSPLYTLDVSGIIRANNEIRMDDGELYNGSPDYPFRIVTVPANNDNANANLMNFYISNGQANGTGDSGRETLTMTLTGAGNVGIGTTNPYNALTVNGGLEVNRGGNGFVFNMDGSATLQLQYENPTSVYSNIMSMTYTGNVGIGTTNPLYNLDVTGTVHATGVINATTSGVKYPDGNTQLTAWTGVLCGGDYAEAVNAKGLRKTYEPGDVLVIGDGTEGEVQKSAEPYSTMVAGIFATKPGVIGRRQSLLKDADEIPMAMVGIVPTKVTAENGPIHRGDLLVTSSTTGYAMKGIDRSRLVGAVIGKAMGSLETGTGVIEVLVTLQ